MIWDITRALLPSMLVHAVIFALTGVLFFWLAKKFDFFPNAANLRPVLAGVVSGLVVSSLMSIDLLAKSQQSRILTAALSEQNAKDPKAQDPKAEAANLLALRGDFLKAIDYLTTNPDQLTVPSKTKLFEQFQPLFATGIGDVRKYHDEIKAAFDCQLSLYEDVRATFKAKVSATSAKTKTCEERSGEFFNRAKLLGPDTLEANRLMKEKILHPNDKSNETKLTEKDVSSLIDSQKRKLATLEKIFE